MTLWTPSRPKSTAHVVSWSIDTSTALDTAGTKTLTMTIAPAFPQPTLVKIDVSGTGIYNLDWRFNPQQNQYQNGGILVAANVTSFPVVLDVNENGDASETHVLALRADGNWYTLGTYPTHTVTCTRGHTKPTTSNTGYLASGSYTTKPDWTITQPGHYEKIIVTNETKIHADDVFLYDCWFKYISTPPIPPNGLKYHVDGTDQVRERLYMDHCSLGLAFNPGPLANGGTGVNSGGGNAWELHFCKIREIGEDGTKFMKNGLIEDCHISKVGGYTQNPLHGSSPHGDCYQWEGQVDGTEPNFTCRHSTLFLPYAGSPDTEGSNWEINSIAELTARAQLASPMLWDRCWIDGGGYTWTLDGKSLGRWKNFQVRNCQIGAQNAGYANSSSGTQLYAPGGPYAKLLNLSDPAGGQHILHRSGNKWDDNAAISASLRNTEIAGFNNEPVWS